MTVKGWFGNQKANELKRNINAFEVECILKETDKAIYAICYLGFASKYKPLLRTFWIPKSVLEDDEWDVPEYISDYDEARKVAYDRCTVAI